MLVVGNHDVRPTFAVRAVFNKAKGAVNSRKLYTRDQLLPYEAFLTEAKQALNSRKLHARAKFCPRSEITKCDVNRPKPLPSAQNPRNAPGESRSERKFADALRESAILTPRSRGAVRRAPAIPNLLLCAGREAKQPRRAGGEMGGSVSSTPTTVVRPVAAARGATAVPRRSIGCTGGTKQTDCSHSEPELSFTFSQNGYGKHLSIT